MLQEDIYFFMPKAQTHCKLITVFSRLASSKKNSQNPPKCPKRTSNFDTFFPTPNPEKRVNTSSLKDFGGVGGIGAPPGTVAKGMLASPDLKAYAQQPATGPLGGGGAGRRVDLETILAPACGYVGPSWAYVGPSSGYVGPSWGSCWAIQGLCWAILRHLSHKIRES